MADVEWRRVFLVSSAIFALLLVSGSIYLHLQKKNHLGRLRYHKDFAAKIGTAVTVQPSDESSDENIDESLSITFPIPFDQHDGGDDDDEDKFPRSDEELADHILDYYMNDDNNVAGSTADLFDKNKMSAPMRNMLHQHNMSETCLNCICETITGCMPSMCLDREPCGIYRISRSYWIFADSPLLENHIENERDSGYLPCVNNVHCAARTVLGFIENYARDCNGDGIIDCRDHIELHLLGLNCMKYDASPKFLKRVEQCLNKGAQ